MRVFISYRRNDSSGYAGRLYDYLAKHFGPDEVFMDIDKINPGQDFTQVLKNAINSCDMLIVVIGEQWLNISDENGQKRLENPTDWVRVEISTALKSGIPIIPVLVQNVSVPKSEDLPDELKGLSKLQALEISDVRFRYDVERLISAIEKYKIIETPVNSKKNLSEYSKQITISLGVIVLVSLLIFVLSKLSHIPQEGVLYFIVDVTGGVGDDLEQSISITKLVSDTSDYRDRNVALAVYGSQITGKPECNDFVQLVAPDSTSVNIEKISDALRTLAQIRNRGEVGLLQSSLLNAITQLKKYNGIHQIFVITDGVDERCGKYDRRQLNEFAIQNGVEFQIIIFTLGEISNEDEEKLRDYANNVIPSDQAIAYIFDEIIIAPPFYYSSYGNNYGITSE